MPQPDRWVEAGSCEVAVAKKRSREPAVDSGDSKSAIIPKPSESLPRIGRGKAAPDGKDSGTSGAAKGLPVDAGKLLDRAIAGVGAGPVVARDDADGRAALHVPQVPVEGPDGFPGERQLSRFSLLHGVSLEKRAATVHPSGRPGFLLRPHPPTLEVRQDLPAGTRWSRSLGRHPLDEGINSPGLIAEDDP
jgi:hypothetical protein